MHSIDVGNLGNVGNLIFSKTLFGYSLYMNPNNSELLPYKEKEYHKYLVWKLLPKVILETPGMVEDLGIEIAEIDDLLGIKTQKEFAKRFGIHQSTLTEWNKKPIPKEFEHLNYKYWARGLTKNIVFALYEGILECKDAARINLWFKYIENANQVSPEPPSPRTFVDLIKLAEEADEVLKQYDEETRASL